MNSANILVIVTMEEKRSKKKELKQRKHELSPFPLPERDAFSWPRSVRMGRKLTVAAAHDVALIEFSIFLRGRLTSD